MFLMTIRFLTLLSTKTQIITVSDIITNIFFLTDTQISMKDVYFSLYVEYKCIIWQRNH